jgi:hypothetical protein
MITLITLNLYLFLNQAKLFPQSSLMKPQNIGYVGVIVMIIFGILTRWDFTYPNRVSFKNFMSDRVDEKVISSIQEGEEVCLVGFSPLSFLYISKFHPDLNRNYSIKSEFTISPEYVKEKCGDRRIIYKD